MNGIPSWNYHHSRHYCDNRKQIKSECLYYHLAVQKCSFIFFISKYFTCMAHLPVYKQLIRFPIDRHWLRAYLYHRAIPHAFLLQIQVWSLYNGINRTGFLAKSTINTFHHIDIVASCSPTPIWTRFCFNGNGLSWANRLAELACDTPFFTIRIPAKGVLTTKSWT